MTSRRDCPPLTLIHSSAALLAATSLALTLWTGVEERGVALAFGLLVAAGELSRWTGTAGLRETALLWAAGLVPPPPAPAPVASWSGARL